MRMYTWIFTYSDGKTERATAFSESQAQILAAAERIKKGLSYYNPTSEKLDN